MSIGSLVESRVQRREKEFRVADENLLELATRIDEFFDDDDDDGASETLSRRRWRSLDVDVTRKGTLEWAPGMERRTKNRPFKGLQSTVPTPKYRQL